MPQYPDLAIRPPEKVEASYEEVTRQPLWTDSGALALDMHGASTLHFCTDAECSALSGVPERSLRLLQTSGVIHATKAPLPGGSYKRVWHLPEAAAATVIECLKKATGIDYATLAKISFHAAVFSRMLFVDYLEMQEQGSGDQFGANLLLSHNRVIGLQIPPALKILDPELRRLSVGDLIPIAGIDDGESKAVPLDRASRREDVARAFVGARFATVIYLKNVFEQFERDARKMRT